MKLDHLPTPYTKINSKWIKYLNVRPKALKLLDENRSSKLLDAFLRDDFLDSARKSNATSKKSRWDYIQLKNLHSKGNRQQNKEAWEKRRRGKTFTNHILDKGLTPKIYK